LINIEENDQIAAIARIAEQEDDEDEAMTDTIENTGDENQEATENETTE